MSGILAYKSEHYARNMVLSTYLIRKDFKLVLKLEEGHNEIMAFNISTLMTQDRKEPRSGDQSRSKIIQKGRNKVGNFQKEKPSMDPCLRKSLCWWKVATPTQSAESPLGVKTYCNPTTTMHLNSSWSSKVLAIVSLLLHEGLPDHCSNLLNQKHFSVSPTASFCNHFLKRTSKAYCDSSKYGKSLQSSPTLRDPMDCSPPGSSCMEFSRQEYWSGLHFSSPEDLSNPGIKPVSLLSPALADMFFTIITTCKLRSGVWTPVISEF